jgi:hypothetical protein
MSRDVIVDLSRNDNLNQSLLRHLNYNNNNNHNEDNKYNSNNVTTKASDMMYRYEKNLDHLPLASFSSTLPLPSPPPIHKTVGTYMTEQSDSIEKRYNKDDYKNDDGASVLNETAFSTNDTFITANDPFINPNDTSINITRQIDDVGKAISTLQKRIASYMYISPDSSPNLNHRAQDNFSASPAIGMDRDGPSFGTLAVDDIHLAKYSPPSTDVDGMGNPGTGHSGKEGGLNIVPMNVVDSFGRSGNNTHPNSPRGVTFDNIYPPDPGDFIGSGSYSHRSGGYVNGSEHMQRMLDPSISQRHPIFTALICREDTDSDTDMDYDQAKVSI